MALRCLEGENRWHFRCNFIAFVFFGDEHLSFFYFDQGVNLMDYNLFTGAVKTLCSFSEVVGKRDQLFIFVRPWKKRGRPGIETPRNEESLYFAPRRVLKRGD